MEGTRRIIISGGGTGGHVMPALAVMDIIREMDNVEMLYVGGYKGIENHIIPKLGIPLKRLWISGFARGEWIRNLLFPLKLVVSLLQAFIILLRYKPLMVVGTGGYVTGPIIYMASLLSMQTIIIEADVFPGITSRLLGRMVDKIFVANPEAKKYFRNVRPHKITVSGNPIRTSIRLIAKEKACENLGLTPDKKTVAILGGSQGARFINNAILKICENFPPEQVQFIWQAGKLDYERIREQLPQTFAGKVAPFLDDMASVYSAADVVVCRSGAITLAELAKMRKPAILIPYPSAAGDHQRKNAQKFVQFGVARMLEQSENNFANTLKEWLEILLTKDEIRNEMISNWSTVDLPDTSAILREEFEKGLR